MKTVASISGSELDAFSNMKGSDLVRALFDKLGGSVYRDGFGEVLLDKYGAKGTSTGGHSPNKFKYLSMLALPEIIRNGKMVFTEDTRHPGKLGYMFAAPVSIMGKTTYVGAVVHKFEGDGVIKYYLTDMLDENGQIFTVYEKNTSDSENRIPRNSEVIGASVVSSDDRIPQTQSTVKIQNESSIGVDTDTETPAGTETRRTQEQGRTSQEPLQDTDNPIYRSGVEEAAYGEADTDPIDESWKSKSSGIHRRPA
ncbi:MAG: hypothetical protein MJ074_09515 [Oscillospiraceae bacterium]|nr:hypothetical protein [Oscillospiraceae bacterium]